MKVVSWQAVKARVRRRKQPCMGRSDLETVILNEASAETPRQFLDCSKARRTLACTPTYTFEEGLRETIAWYTASLAAASEQPALNAAARGGER
jgi:nucleoside-diphosphate-sugar epimerase